MKKFTILTLFTAFLLVGVTANAQEQGMIRASAGLALGTKAAIDESGTKAGIGINIGAEYLITDNISIAPSYTFFFKSEFDTPDGFGGNVTSSNQFGSFNIDGRYYFGDGDMELYGLFGIGIVSNSFEQSGDDGFGGTITIDGSDSETGLNIGGGINYPLSDALFLNGQIKYNTVDIDGGQIVINAGVAYSFGG